MQSTVRRRLADHIWQWRKVVYVASTAIVAVVLIAVFLSISLPDTIPELSSEPTFVDGNRAYRAAQELAAGFPEREPGSEASRGASQWLRERLDDLDVPYVLQTFDARLGTEDRTLENVIVTLPGQTADSLLVTMPRTDSIEPELSPLANATSTALLLDLIQVFTARPHDKTLVFLSSEGAQFGGLGLAHYLEGRSEAGRIESVLSVRGLGKEGREVLTGAVSGTDTATPGWYVQLTSAILADADLQLELPSIFDQIVIHALRLASGEQVAGLVRGIPSLSLHDPVEGTVTPEGLATQGALIERLLLSLDQGAEVPTAAPAALVLPSGRFLTSRALAVLGYLMLVPSAVLAFTWLAVIQIRPESWMRYLSNVTSFFLPPAAFLGLAWLLGYLRILPSYPIVAPREAGPAANPELLPTLGLVAAGLVIFFLSRHFLGYLRPREPLVMAEMTKLATGLLVLLAGLLLLASYSAFSLLTAVTAAWLWPLSSCFYEPKHFGVAPWPRLRSNIVLLVAGFTAPLALYAFLATRTPLGWTEGWWYLLVQTVSGAYGLRGPAASALITAGFLLLIGVKRLRLLPVDTYEGDRRQVFSEAPPRVRRVVRTEGPARGAPRTG